MNDYGDMMKGFDQFNAEAGAYSGDGSAIRIEAACMQGEARWRWKSIPMTRRRAYAM